MIRFLGSLILLLAICARPTIAEEDQWWGDDPIVSVQLFAFEAPEGLDVSRLGVVLVHGAIESATLPQFRQAIDEAEINGVHVMFVGLVSPGGSLLAGIELGREIRSRRLAVAAPHQEDQGLAAPDCLVSLFPDFPGMLPWLYNWHNNCFCRSACALAWIGGVFRSGDVALHHHFRDEIDGISFDDYDEQMSRATRGVAEYLNEMRAPDGFMQAWIDTPSTGFVFVSSAGEGNPYELDPHFREFLISSCGPLPPGYAYSYHSQQEIRASEGRLSEGEAFAFSLLDSYLDNHRVCSIRTLLDMQRESGGR